MLAPTSADQALLQQLKIANDIVQNLSALASRDLDPEVDGAVSIAQALAEQMVSRLEAATARVWFYEPYDHSFRSVAQVGIASPIDDLLDRMVPDDSPLGQVVRRAEPLLSNDPAQEPWILAPEWVKQENLAAFAAYPIRLGSERLGALSIFTRRKLQPEFLEVLKFICSFVATTLANARQTRQLQQQTQRDALIRQLSQQLRHSLDLETMQRTLVEQVGQMLGVDRCDFLQLIHTDPTAPCSPIVLSSYDRSGILVESVYQPILQLPGLRLHLQGQQSLVVSDLSEFLAGIHPFRACLMVPLLLQVQSPDLDDGVGFLALLQTHPRVFTDGEVQLIQAVAVQAALALNNAKLFERTRQQAEREALLNRISSMVHRSLHWDEIVTTALVSLRETLGLSRCCFFAVFSDPAHLSVTHEAKDPHLVQVDHTLDLAEFGLLCSPMYEGQILQFDDLGHRDCFCSQAQELAESLEIQSGVLVPVDLEPSDDIPSLIGLVGAFKSQPYRWDGAEVELLQSVAAQLAIALTRAELFAQIHQQAERLSLLHSMTGVIRSSLDPETLFYAITQQIGEAFQADLCVLSLWQPIDQCLRPVGIYAPQLSASDLETLLPGLTVLSQVQPRDVISETGLRAARFPGAVPDSTLSKLQLGSDLLQVVRAPVTIPEADLLLIPLLERDPDFGTQSPHTPTASETLIGSLSLKRIPMSGDPDSPRSWQSADLELAKAVAEQAAIAIGQARLLTQTQHLLTQTQRQAERASLLNRMLDRIRHSLDLDEILQATVEEVGEALQASRAQFVFVNPHDSHAAIRHAFAQPGVESWLHHHLPLLNNPVAPGLWEQTESIVVNVWSTTAVFDPDTQERLQQSGVQSLIIARLYLGHQTYGVLSAHHCSPRQWTDDDQSLMRAVGEQLVIAINQSRLYEKTQQQARREALINQITADLHTSLDPHQVLQSIVQSLATTLELDRCEIILYKAQGKLPSPSHGEGEPTFFNQEELFAMGTAHEASVQPAFSFAHRIAEVRFMAAASSTQEVVPVSSGAFPYAQGVKPGSQPACCLDAQISDRQISDPQLSDPQRVEKLGSLPPGMTDQEFCWLHPEVYRRLCLGQPIVIADAQTNPLPPFEQQLPLSLSSSDFLQTFFQTISIRSLALIPILQEGDLIGTIAMISFPNLREFAPEELSLATAVAEQAAIALKQAQLYEQTRSLALRESLLRQIAQQFTTTLDQNQILHIAMTGMADALQVDSCQVLVWAGSGDLIPQAANGSHPFAWTPTLSHWIRSRCLESQEVVLTDHPHAVPPHIRQELGRMKIRSLLCVPVIVSNDQVAGVLCAVLQTATTPDGAGENPWITTLSSTDAELVKALADMTAVALQRAQFYEQARQQEAKAAVARGLTEGREAESRRLAADLHDQTLADLGALSRQMQQYAYAECIPAPVLVQMSDQLRETIAELRGVVEDLQPTAMRAFTMASAVRSLLERAAQRANTPLLTRFDDRSDNALDRLDPTSQTTLFRIVQEALNNIVKHAQAQRVDIIIVPLNPDPANLPAIAKLDIKIIDDGLGMPMDPIRLGSHGLLNMRYRAELIGATIEWRQRRMGRGTVVQIILPLPGC